MFDRILYFILVVGVPLCGFGKSPTSQRPKKVDGLIAKVSSDFITKRHYLGQRLNDKISTNVFRLYFDALDPHRYYFYQSDINDFKSYKILIDDLLIQGNVDFAFDVYQLFLRRVEQRIGFVRTRIETPFDYSLDESYTANRSKSPWCKNKEELDEVWRIRLKNDFLNRILLEEQHQKIEESKNVEFEEEKTEKSPHLQGVKESEMEESREPQEKPPGKLILENYEKFYQRLQDKEPIEILEIFLASLARSYDPHSTYMAPITKENFDISMRHSLEGIGATLTMDEGYVKVSGIIPGGAADRDGRLKEGDLIVAVTQEDGEEIDIFNLGLRKVVSLIRGPKGTEVTLSIIEAGKDIGFKPVQIIIRRDKIKLADRGAKLQVLDPQEILDLRTESGEKSTAKPKGGNKIAVVSLPSFYSDFEGKKKGLKNYKSATRDVIDLIEEAKRQAITGVIIDLRSNSGGSLDEAVSLAGVFFSSGPVVQVRFRNGRKSVYEDDDGKTFYDGPLIVLVDRYSASASEIFAAAIQDHHRGIIIGEQSTHGKGTVQTLHSLKKVIRNRNLLKGADPGSLKITTAKFYRINGSSTQNKGVSPDLVFPSFRDHMEIGEVFLEGALDWDEIAKIPNHTFTDIEPIIPILRKNFNSRLSSRDWYEPLLLDIKRFGEWNKDKAVSLHKEKRVRLEQEEKEWFTRIKSYGLRKRNRDADVKNDTVLKEALLVISDLIDIFSQGLKENHREPVTEGERIGVHNKL